MTASAADHPDFNGTWKMDASRSDFGPLPGPSQLTDRLVQTGAQIVINRNREGRDTVIQVPLDGHPRENVVRGSPMKTQGHWDGRVLVVDFTGERGGSPVKSEERWVLAPDGRSIRVTRHLSGAQGETEQTLTLVRVDAPTH